MNRNRRKSIMAVVAALGELRGLLEDQLSDVKSLKDLEQKYVDFVPENLRDTDRYMEAKEAVQSLEDATEALEEAIQEIGEAIDALTEVGD